jgi:hypothetical protein
VVSCPEIVQNYIQYLEEGFNWYSDGPYFVISTPHLYSDGDTIELYVEQVDDQIRISDMGETARRLALVKFNWNTIRSRSLFSHIINSTGVSSSRGALYVNLSTSEKIGDKISDLIQAIQQTENLIFTIQKYATQAFREDVESFLRKEGFEPDLNYQIEGKSGMPWRVHFYMNHNSNIVLKALSASSKGGAKYQMMTTYTAYDDIKKRHQQMVRSVILDDEIPDIWEVELIHLASEVVDTNVGYWSKREIFGEQLHALSH